MAIAPISTPVLASRQPSAQVPAVAAGALPDDRAPQEEGVQVSFSEAMRERLGKMREASRAFKARSLGIAETRKQQARERIEQIRQRIKQLTLLVASLGGLAPKGVLREIEQLARSLGQAAVVLKEGGTAMVPGSASADETGGSLASSVEGEGAAAAEVEAVVKVAEVQAASDGEAVVDDQVILADVEQEQEQEQERHELMLAGRDEREQRREDAELIGKAVRELKALLALVRATMQDDDQDSENRLKRIDRDIVASEKVAQSLALSAMGDDGGAAVSAGVSITV